MKTTKAVPSNIIQSARGCFNAHLNKILLSESNTYIMAVNSLDEYPDNYFNPRGELSNAGKEAYWKEISNKLKRFERKEIELKPTPPTVIKRHTAMVQQKFLLPRPPPKRNQERFEGYSRPHQYWKKNKDHYY